MKTLEELRKLDHKKLSAELAEMQKELFKVSFDVKNGQSKNNHLIRNYSRQIARIQTVLKKQEPNNQPTQ